MSVYFLNIGILALLILFNGFMCLSEVAIIASRRTRLQTMIDDGVSGARRGLQLVNDPNGSFSTIQTGITAVSLLSGIFGQSALVGPVAEMLEKAGLPEETCTAVSTVLVLISLTFVSILFGELVPKLLGQRHPEKLLCRIAPALHGLSIVLAPFVKLLSSSARLILKLLHADTKPEEEVSAEDIRAIIDVGEKTGVIEANEHDMVRNVFRLDDRQVGSLMTPRNDIEWIDVEDPPEANIDKVKHSHFSRLPVCEGSLDNVKGFCTTRTLLRQMMETGKPDFRANLAPAFYVPESITGMELLENFRKTNASAVLVVDEYGAVQGIVTPRDVFEAITGQFQPDSPEETMVRKREDGSVLLDGIISVPELKDALGLKTVPDEEEARYNTLAGMMMLLLGRVPKDGDIAEWEGWRLEVVDMDGRRIDKVLAVRVKKAAAPAPADGAAKTAPKE
ncbi:MAG: HlyC/CorC family transporter [Burkholderia sp.]|jgi:putative hemolysin